MSKKRLTVVFVVALLLAAHTASTAPSIYGPRGLFRVLSANPEDRGTLSLNIHLLAFSQPLDTGFVDTRGDTVHGRASDTYGAGDLYFTLGYSILDVWSLYYGGSLKGDAIDTDNLGGRTEWPVGRFLGYDNRRSIGLGDMQVGTKLTLPLLPRESESKLYLGLDGFASFPTGAKWKMDMLNDTLAWRKMDIGSILENQGGVFRFFSSNGIDGGGRFLFTFQTPGDVPVLFHTNVGYIYRSYAADPDMIANQLVAGFGTEVQVGYLTPFIEVTTEQWIHDSQDSLGTSPIRVSPGIRFNTPFGLGIDLGADFRVSSENEVLPDTHFYVTTGLGAAPPWAIHFGLSYVYDFLVPPKAPPKGVVAGKVYDAETDEPLGATISFPSDTALASTTSELSTGLYKIQLDEGTYRIRVSKNGYMSKDIPVQVFAKRTSLLDVALQKKVVARGELTGKITDASNGQPVGANVSFPGTDVPKTASDLSTGIYKATLPPGTYTVEVVADGYVAQALPVVVEKDRAAIQNFELLKKGGKITLRGINFDTGKATIKPESFPILNQAAELLKKNPKVRVEIQGHTDSVGSDSYNLRLSEARANSVYQYLLSQGIEPARLTARGYGETMPIADNRTRDGRALNRRIDFQILSQ
jgi:outer membrane protein OmpA-like peptidoglycan-associated protein